jgi:hypothetical protein
VLSYSTRYWRPEAGLAAGRWKWYRLAECIGHPGEILAVRLLIESAEAMTNAEISERAGVYSRLVDQMVSRCVATSARVVKKHLVCEIRSAYNSESYIGNGKLAICVRIAGGP